MKTKIKASGESGFSLIELIIVVMIIGIIAAIAVPNLLNARRSSNEASAVSSISLIYRSQLTYRMAEGEGEFATLSELHNRFYIDETLGAGANTKSGYQFEIDIYPSMPGVYSKFDLRGRPVTHTLVNSVVATGGSDFGVNESGSIFMTDDNTPVTFDINTRLATGTATPIDGN